MNAIATDVRAPRDDEPALFLVDDDGHSARFLVRALGTVGADGIRVVVLGPEDAARRLAAPSPADGDRPGMVLVDLKAHSRATLDFVARTAPDAARRGIPVAAMAPTLEAPVRNTLIEAGAAAVFERNAELALYLREIADLADFWRRHAATTVGA